MELPSIYQSFIYKSRYARWNEIEGRRENWPETVQRYFDFFSRHLAENCNYALRASDNVGELYQAVLNLETMPSMRCLMTAGRALERDNIAGYNCSYIPVDSARSFDEILFILMCGTGVGFSVERQYISQLAPVPSELRSIDKVITVRDSKRGWAEALKQLLHHLWEGEIPKWDLSNVRPAGSRLKKMGGRASGPGPLADLFSFAIRVFDVARGRKLTSLECHDLACKIGDCVVMGGVRRSALISLSNLSDLRMREAKTGEWWVSNPQRALANNSVAYSEKPDVGQFLEEWLALYRSRSGERGIFNREAARKQAIGNGRRESSSSFGTNPCGEIILRGRQFCNLSEVVSRPNDGFDSLARKIRIATILGTWQSTLTKFRYISREFVRNCEEERLLGVSVTGILDCPVLYENPSYARELWSELREVALQTNRNWADRLGINRSAAITCVKPSGTVSQLVDAASGIHPRFAPFYLRRVRNDVKDPISTFLVDRGFPVERDHLKPEHLVFAFPQKAPSGSRCRNDLTAIEHLELWKLIKETYCEHNPSITVSIREAEWPSVGAWVWSNFDSLSGVAFLPYSDHSYAQAPYEEITEDQYHEALAKLPAELNWDELALYENEDNTVGGQELACAGNHCEI